MIIKLYNENPNVRDVRHVADALRDGEVVILPTDTLYAFACSMDHKRAVEEIAQLKGFKVKQAKYSMLCSDLSMASEYVRAMDRDTFALLKRSLPGPFTFIMEAAGSVPRNYQNQNHTIGIRIPDCGITRAIIEELGTPLISTSVTLGRGGRRCGKLYRPRTHPRPLRQPSLGRHRRRCRRCRTLHRSRLQRRHRIGPSR